MVAVHLRNNQRHVWLHAVVLGVAQHKLASSGKCHFHLPRYHCIERRENDWRADDASWRIGNGRDAARELAAAQVDRTAGGVPQLPPNMLDMPIEELDLPMRAYNSLKRNNIVKVGQLLQLKDDDLLRMRNFGKKSLDEMKERLRMRGFIVPETEAEGIEGEGENGFDDEAES